MTADTARSAPYTIPPTGLLIDGAHRPARSGEDYVSRNPATGQAVAEISAAGADDIDDAVAAARSAFEEGPWARMSGPERGRILTRAADLIEQDAPNLGGLETLEMGKLFGDSVEGDVPCAADTFRHFAGWADKIRGSFAQLPDFGPQPRIGFTLRQPLGVIGAITPWNNPLAIASWKTAPALAAGNTMVIKPPEDAALSTLRLGEILTAAGLPDGVFNVVPGLGETAGAALAAHDGVDKITFTGSPRVGATIRSLAGHNYRRLTLELGGKSPQIVLADADLSQAMPWIAMGNFYHQGQVCAAGSRVLVHQSRLDEVVDGLTAAAADTVVGDPFDPASTMGSLANDAQLARVLRYIGLGRSEGATVHAGGGRVGERGCFVEPTVFTGTNEMTIAREEIFGPVATVIPFRDVDEAVRIANDTRYGLNAMIYGQDLSAVHSLIPRLRVGTVWVNGWGVPDVSMPWGGRGASGIGRELGESGLHACTEEKTVYLGL